MNKLEVPKLEKVFIPDQGVVHKGCPYCGGETYDGFSSRGVVTFTCRSCNGQWSGGLPTEDDPRRPEVPSRFTPPATYESNPRRGGEPIETERSVPLEPAYRCGAPVYDDEELRWPTP